MRHPPERCRVVRVTAHGEGRAALDQQSSNARLTEPRGLVQRGALEFVTSIDERAGLDQRANCGDLTVSHGDDERCRAGVGAIGGRRNPRFEIGAARCQLLDRRDVADSRRLVERAGPGRPLVAGRRRCADQQEQR
jgi:hypothetical protein